MPRVERPVVIFSKGKSDFTYTSRWFKEYSYKSKRVLYLLSGGDNIADYQKNTGCRAVIARGVSTLSQKFNWCIENLTTDLAPWFIMMGDNVLKVHCVIKEKYHLEKMYPNCHADFRSRLLSPQETFDIIDEDIKKAESINAYVGGFANNESNLFRKFKYYTAGFIWWKVCYARRGSPDWPDLPDKSDYGFSAACLVKTGRTLANRWVYAWAKKYEDRGGSAGFEERQKSKKEAFRILRLMYPGLFFARRKIAEATELQIAPHSEAQLDNWRYNFLSAKQKELFE